MRIYECPDCEVQGLGTTCWLCGRTVPPTKPEVNYHPGILVSEILGEE